MIKTARILDVCLCTLNTNKALLLPKMKKPILLFTMLISSIVSFTQEYSINGDAIENSQDCFQMTEAVNGQLSSFFANEQIDLNEPFEFIFELNFGFNPGGADGMVFILQNHGTDYLGVSGGGIGFENGQTTQSLGIEFDTFLNPEREDLSADHIGIISQASTSHIAPTGLTPAVQMSATTIDVEDGQDHLAKVYWDPVSQIISVDFDCVFRTSANVDLIQDVFGGNSLVYWGFSSSTGGLNNAQSLCYLKTLEADFPEDCLEPGPVVMTAAGSEASIYSWSPSTTPVSTNNQTVIVDLIETTDYIVTSTDICDGSMITDTITLVVNDLEISVSSDIIDCYSDSILLFGTSNQNTDIEYSWSSSGGMIVFGNDSLNAIGMGQGQYTFTVLDTINGCTRSADYIAPTDFTTPSLFADVDGLLSCINPEVQIQVFDFLALNDYSYEWITENGNIVNENDSVINVNLQSNYTSIVTYNLTGCSDTIDIWVENDPDFSVPLEFVEIPNVITPNADQQNDELKAFLSIDPSFDLSGKLGSYQLDVFNRWGNNVFSSSQLENTWKEIEESSGSYFYVLQYTDRCDLEDIKVKKGSIEILR